MEIFHDIPKLPAALPDFIRSWQAPPLSLWPRPDILIIHNGIYGIYMGYIWDIYIWSIYGNGVIYIWDIITVQ